MTFIWSHTCLQWHCDMLSPVALDNSPPSSLQLSHDWSIQWFLFYSVAHILQATTKKISEFQLKCRVACCLILIQNISICKKKDVLEVNGYLDMTYKLMTFCRFIYGCKELNYKETELKTKQLRVDTAKNHLFIQSNIDKLALLQTCWPVFACIYEKVY